MNPHEAVMNMAIGACRNMALSLLTLSDEELVGALKSISAAHTLGSLLYPTAYRVALHDGRLDRQEAVLRRLLNVKAELRRIFPEDPILAAEIEEAK